MPNGPLLPPDALLFALLAAASFAALDLTQKWSARYAVPTPAAFLSVRLLFGAIIAPLLLLLPNALKDLAASDWTLPNIGLLLGLILVNLLGNILYLWSVYRADISVVGSLWPLKNFYLPFLAFLLPPHERFSPLIYALIFGATLGAFGVAYNKKLGLAAFKERPVWLMILVTVPVFALSDLLFRSASLTFGARFTTVLVAWGLALIGLPLLLIDPRTREAVHTGLSSKRGRIGGILTGLFLIIGVACIGEAFARSKGAVIVNVYAMSSGLILLAANALVPGWLDREKRETYVIRFAGAIVLVSAAAWLLLAPVLPGK